MQPKIAPLPHDAAAVPEITPFQAAFENGPDCLLIMDDTGRFLEANRAACQLLNNDRRTLLAMSLLDVLDADGISSSEGFAACGRGRHESRLRPLFGDERYVEFSVAADFLPGWHLVSLRDISEDKREAQETRGADNRYRALAEAAPDDIYVLNWDGVVQYANPACARRLGKTPEAIVGKSLGDIFPARMADANLRSIRRVCEHREPTYEERSLQFGDWELWSGTWLVPLPKPSGEVSEVMGVSRDITPQKIAETALRSSEARYRALFESNPQPMWVYDVETHAFLAVNDAAIAHYGYARHEFLKMTIDEICPPEIAGAVSDALPDGAAPTPGPGTLRHRKRDGTIIEVEISMHKMAFGERPAHLILAHDVTARRDAERALQWANDELEHRVQERTAELGSVNESLRVENVEHQMTMGALREAAEALRHAKETADVANTAKSEFLSRMSHELRTPLNAILGFGQILANQDLPLLALESVGYILRGGRHLLDLINEVLDISRVEAGHLDLSLEPVSLADILPEACALVRTMAAERSIQLTHDGGIGAGYVLADLQRLKQVLLNLLANAIKYNREGGDVEVSCRLLPEGRIAIAIRDTGPGIAPDDLPKLFTPFERLGAAASEIEGTGLGLALSRRLLTAMGGSLTVVSCPGSGSTFTIDLPAADSGLEVIASSPEVLHHPRSVEMAGGTYTVLCIEDNPSNLKLLEFIFQERPEITLLTAVQGSIGLDLARQHEPDLVLLDLNLPDIHGREVLARLRQSDLTRTIPVVIVSADATQNQVERLMEDGARAFLTKPLDVDQLLETVDQILNL